jgi:ribosomal protein S18 acetylase RimI-like enzyme
MNRHRLIGGSRISITAPDRAILNNIYIERPFRSLGYGSQFMREMEEHLCKSYFIREFHLLAWQPSGSYDVVDFYKKNGFQVTTDRVDTYDDSSILYDLYYMHKKIDDE